MARRDTRTEIIDAAVRVLGRDGPDGFSAAALAREVGISKANLFHHFPSIDAIPVAAFERMIASRLAGAPPGGANLTETVGAIGAGTFGMVEQQRDFLRAYFVFAARSLFDRKLGAEFRASGDVLMAQLRNALEPLIAEGEDVTAIARLAAMMLDGLGVHLVAFNRGPDVEAAWRLFLELLTSKGKKP
jgi:AcrR family transcriptional regulator